MEEKDIRQIKVAGGILVFSVLLMIVTKIMTFDGGPKAKLEKLMDAVGGTYYEQVFFVENQESLNSYANGYTITLRDAMDIIDYTTDKFVNHKTKQECDLEASYIIITPKSPYGQKDYDIQSMLGCGY